MTMRLLPSPTSLLLALQPIIFFDLINCQLLLNPHSFPCERCSYFPDSHSLFNPKDFKRVRIHSNDWSFHSILSELEDPAILKLLNHAMRASNKAYLYITIKSSSEVTSEIDGKMIFFGFDVDLVIFMGVIYLLRFQINETNAYAKKIFSKADLEEIRFFFRPFDLLTTFVNALYAAGVPSSYFNGYGLSFGLSELQINPKLSQMKLFESVKERISEELSIRDSVLVFSEQNIDFPSDFIQEFVTADSNTRMELLEWIRAEQKGFFGSNDGLNFKLESIMIHVFYIRIPNDENTFLNFKDLEEYGINEDTKPTGSWAFLPVFKDTGLSIFQIFTLYNELKLLSPLISRNLLRKPSNPKRRSRTKKTKSSTHGVIQGVNECVYVDRNNYRVYDFASTEECKCFVRDGGILAIFGETPKDEATYVKFFLNNTEDKLAKKAYIEYIVHDKNVFVVGTYDVSSNVFPSEYTVFEILPLRAHFQEIAEKYKGIQSVEQEDHILSRKLVKFFASRLGNKSSSGVVLLKLVVIVFNRVKNSYMFFPLITFRTTKAHLLDPELARGLYAVLFILQETKQNSYDICFNIEFEV